MIGLWPSKMLCARDLDGIIGRVHKVVEVLVPARAVRVPNGIATWESCVDADVMMQLMGIPPSAVSTCSLYPIQEVVWPLALRLLPTSQALGRSASICGRLIVSCRSSRLERPSPDASPLRGRMPLAPLRLRCLRLRRRLLPRFNRRRIPRDVLQADAPSDRPRNQSSHADGWPDGSRQTRKRPAKTSPRSEAGRHRSSRTAGKACRQHLKNARSGRASSERRTRPWLSKARASAARSSSGTPYLCRRTVGDQKSLDPHQFQIPRRTARSARPSGQARSRASGTTLVERRTSNPHSISRRDTRSHSSVKASCGVW